MKRDYTTGEKQDIIFFVGKEIEPSSFYMMQTLFVVGLQSTDKIVELAKLHNCEHVYLGANKSNILQLLNTGLLDTAIKDLEEQVGKLIDNNLKVTIDTSHSNYGTFLNYFKYIDSENFNLMLSVEMPNIKKFKNVSVKIDDTGFKETNDNIVVYSFKDGIQKMSKVVSWDEYSQDLIIKE